MLLLDVLHMSFRSILSEVKFKSMFLYFLSDLLMVESGLLTMKKNKLFSFAGKWMELENIILSEVSLAQKTKNRMFSLICGH
jgi:hypothetical protein